MLIYFIKRAIAILFCACQTASFSQVLKVSVTVSNPSPYVTSVSSTEFERQLLDTVVSSCEKELKYLSSRIAVIKAGLVAYGNEQYTLDLRVVDTVVYNRNNEKFQFIMVYATLWDHNSKQDSLPPLAKPSGASYGKPNQNDISEIDARKAYFHMIQVAAHSILIDYLPLSLSKPLPSRNMSQNWLTMMPYYKNIVVKFQSNDRSLDVDLDAIKVRTLINNIFLWRQHFYARARRLNGAYFNYYMTSATDTVPKTYGNPIQVTFAIEKDMSGYTVTLRSHDQSIKLDPSTSIVQIEKSILEKNPTIINGRLTEAIATFLFNNL